MSKIAFVDICGTLFNSNTTMDFLALNSPAFKRKRESLFYRILNKLSRTFIKYDFIRVKGVLAVSGKTRAELDTAAESFYNSYLTPRVINETHQLINDLKQQGFKIVFISATMDFIAQVIARRLNADQLFSTSLEYQNDICSGKISHDLLGQKHLKAREYLAKETQPVEEIVVITDDKTDLVLAQMAQRVYVVAFNEHDDFWKSGLSIDHQIIKK